MNLSCAFIATLIDSVNRNAAKARSRDAIGRTQKNHFGRQRMQNMLSKGFIVPTLASPSSRPIPQFDLEHARRDFLDHEEHTPSRTEDEAYIEQPCTPRRSDGTRTSSRGSASKVLRAMDQDERARFITCNETGI